MLKSFRARWLSVFLVLLGCSGGAGEGNHSPASNDSAGGTSDSAGKSGGSALGGASANTGLAGGGGAIAGAGAPSGGSGAASAGNTASGGHGADAAGRGGASAVAGSFNGGASSGGRSGGVAGSGGSGPAPTFTMIYDSIITPSCGGTQCHLKRPTPFGYDFSSKSAASASWRADVLPGDADNSPMFQVLNFAIMPKDRPPLSLEQLYLVYDWINAGALDN